MPCPQYQGEVKCGFKDVSYEISPDVVEKFCNSESCWSSCPVMLEKVAQEAQKRDYLEQRAQSQPKLTEPRPGWLKESLEAATQSVNQMPDWKKQLLASEKGSTI